MYKPKDSDIFNTKNQVVHPLISTPPTERPISAFERKTNQNYQQYTASLVNPKQTITKSVVHKGKVNEDANFEEGYHRQRKENDLQSSIFYPPTARITRKDVTV